MNKPKKFIPVMLMPFQEDLSIDYVALEKLIDFYLEAGAAGLFANCLSSEMFELSKPEMLQSVRFIVEKVKGRVPVVATGTFAGSLLEQADFVQAMYETGIDSVIVITSLLAEESDSNAYFEEQVRKLLALTPGIPLGFYECPVPYKRLIDPDFLGELVQLGRVNYHKDTSLDIEHIQRKIEAADQKPGFGLYDAYMVHAVNSLQKGSAGLSCIQGNYFPELVVWLCQHYDDAEKLEQVNLVQQFFIDQMDVMHYAYPVSAKYYLEKQGFPMGQYTRRRDIEPFDEETERALNQLQRDYEALAQTIGLKIP